MASTADPHGHAHDEHHHELGFWQKYVFSTDHKTIGIQYGLTGLVFLLFGFGLMLIMRWQLANPGTAVPVVGTTLGALEDWLAASHPLQDGHFDWWFWLRPVTEIFPKGVLSADG